jgi:hypothetical protein
MKGFVALTLLVVEIIMYCWLFVTLSIGVKIQKIVVLIKWFVKSNWFNLYSNRLLAMGFVVVIVFNTTYVS